MSITIKTSGDYRLYATYVTRKPLPKDFEYYFDSYYKSLEESKKSESSDLLLTVANESVSFDDYMKKVHNKSFENIYNSYKGKIFNMDNIKG